tara:strand:- start:1 stop:291 length:291 start_codon:yes stop_codon:yes gene_type:complete
MKMRKDGEYFAHIQFVGRDVKVVVKQVKGNKNFDGQTGSWWVGEIDDKQVLKLSKMTESTIRRKSKNECVKTIRDIFLNAYVEAIEKELTKNLGIC